MAILPVRMRQHTGWAHRLILGLLMTPSIAAPTLAQDAVDEADISITILPGGTTAPDTGLVMVGTVSASISLPPLTGLGADPNGVTPTLLAVRDDRGNAAGWTVMLHGLPLPDPGVFPRECRS